MSVIITDMRFHEQKVLERIIRAIRNRRTWIPEPVIYTINVLDFLKIWDTRPRNQVKVTFVGKISEEELKQYFSKYGKVAQIKPAESRGSYVVLFRNESCVSEIFKKPTHKISNVAVKVEPRIRLTPSNQKMFFPVLNDICNCDGLMVILPGKEQCSQTTHMKNRMTMMINGLGGLSPCALQFVLGGHIKQNSKRSLPILQEALESGLVPKTGAITFEIDENNREFDLVIAVDVATHKDGYVASVVATERPYEGSIESMKSVVTCFDSDPELGNLISYNKMTQILERIGVHGKNVLLYRHNAQVESKKLFENEIQACVDFFKGSNVTLIEVASHTSLRILDVEHAAIGKKQAHNEFIITQKVTRICRKVIEFYIRHISKANPLRYSIIFSTNREILLEDSEILSVARFTHNLTKNYVHHKDGSKFPGPLKYADHISKWYTSIMKTMGRGSQPRFHPHALRPIIL